MVGLPVRRTSRTSRSQADATEEAGQAEGRTAQRFAQQVEAFLPVEETQVVNGIGQDTFMWEQYQASASGSEEASVPA